MTDIKQAVEENIVGTLGLEALPMEAQREAIDRFGAIVFQSVIARVMEKLGEQDSVTLGEMFDADASGDEISAFIAERVPDFDALVAEEVGSLKASAADFAAGLAEAA